MIFYLQHRSQLSGNSPKQVFETFPFLSSYWEELQHRFPEIEQTEQFLNILRTECDRWEESCQEWLPLRAVRQQASLGAEAVACLVLAGLTEQDARFGELFSVLQQPLVQRRPTLGLLQQLMQMEQGPSDAWNLCLPLLDQGLLVATNRDTPRAEWAVRVPSAVWSALRGEYAKEPIPGTKYHPSGDFAPIRELILAPEQRAQLSELVLLLSSNRTRAVVVRGLAGSPRIEILGSISREMGRGLFEVDGPLLADEERRRLIGPIAILINCIPALSFELGTGESVDIPPLGGYAGPIGLSLGSEGGLAGPLMDRSVTVHLQPETPEQRLRYWQRELKDHSAEDLHPIAKGFTLSGGHIRKAARVAATHAALDGRLKINSTDVRQATRNLGQRLEFLAARLEDGGDWAHLVVPASTERALHDLQTRCRHREQLATLLSRQLPGGLNRGVRALFEGPSGTGKTLAARILASELGLDLYRVDLAALMNKYIGETEKNLSRVLSRAEDLDVILLLDEGDSLMSRRTDVKTANDRYANLETNYLLQRLETYVGIVLVTTNIGGAIDSAFRRRIDAIVRFHLPQAEERWRLWQLHLPPRHAVQPDELETIALRYEMTGAQIRNASVQAALSAMQGSRGAIKVADLRNAIQSEYRKAGAAVPVEEIRSAECQEHRLSGFLSVIS
ncbi:ATPase family protein associated with various cellular activities (AAA) [Edaphobacter aggregans]|uniref:ATPase family protein associated with various cellular activities (AAA) n=1 Tax=Edaphobacter aggregans TaxID=570835 RepID=A0A3R9PU93_9BACT|nr:ATP-binding protein [Edaphobacter aggregans]RSL17997.1 ATPase family protein associated with various cellular activities (AAA) [Edaphobacter aggregans]